jgi:prepilin-type N-terminal cleavage/methylation domain-containing protein
MNGEKGVTLIEVAISVAVLGIVALSIVSYFKWSLGVFGYADRKATAESLARTQIEQIKNDPWSDTGNYSLVSYPAGYAVTYVFSSLSTTMQKITVTAARSDAPAEAVVLEGYKANR